MNESIPSTAPTPEPVPQVHYVPESVETATGKALADYYDSNTYTGD